MLGIELRAEALAQFEAYAALLDQWSRRMNLLSCRSSGELVDRHLIDSLAAAKFTEKSSRMIDLGSGAGFPGVPLAIIRPDLQTTLLEARSRRASFLREVRRVLCLDRVTIEEGRAERRDAIDPYDVAVCRAVWAPPVAARIGMPWLSSGGRMVIFCGESFSPLVAGGSFEPGFQIEAHVAYGAHVANRAPRILVLKRNDNPGS